jgi:hypothetical protein
MKILSILAIMLSTIGVVISLMIMGKSECSCAASEFFEGSLIPDEAIIGGIIMLMISLFFMVFSVVAAVSTFREKPPMLTETGLKKYPPLEHEPTEKNSTTNDYQNPFK